jgi:hypothetical protein
VGELDPSVDLPSDVGDSHCGGDYIVELHIREWTLIPNALRFWMKMWRLSLLVILLFLPHPPTPQQYIFIYDYLLTVSLGDNTIDFNDANLSYIKHYNVLGVYT